MIENSFLIELHRKEKRSKPEGTTKLPAKCSRATRLLVPSSS